MNNKKDNMIFQKLGGKYQLLLDNPSNLRFIPDLDEAHWIATSAPIDSFTCDKVFLQYIDTDNNQRIRSDELKSALKWLFSVIKDLSILSDNSKELNLNSININTDIGKQIKSSAERILKNLKAENRDVITLSQARSNKEILSTGECNGDGVIPVSSINITKSKTTSDVESKNANTVKFINDIIGTIGSVEDLNGAKGINVELLDKFLLEAKSYVEWYDKGCLEKDEKSSPVMVRGEETVPAYRAIENVKEKIDEFFLYCQMLQVDDGIEKRFHSNDDTINTLNMNDKGAILNHIKSAPLATPNKELILHLDDNVNPLFTKELKTFTEIVLSKSNKKSTSKSKEKSRKKISYESLTYLQWELIKEEFATFATWDKGKVGGAVEPLGIDVIREYLNGIEEKKLKPLFKKDLAIAAEIAQISDVEKLILFKQLLLNFANDFVSLSRLFDPRLISMIEVGKLIMDGRHFYLNVKIKDLVAHKKVAIKSNICVMYISIMKKDKKDGKVINIATCVTSGRITNLYIGKRGVFFTHDNEEWDAEIIDFIQMPVSITEALLLPFKKLNEFIKKQTEKFSNNSYQKIEKGVGGTITNISNSASAPQPQKTSWTGPLMLLGGGIGLAGVGSAFASVTNALKHISILKVSLFVLFILIICALPIIIAAFIKLRRRNVGMFLEAGGWAMNSPIKLSRKIGLIFTRTPALPKESSKKYFERSNSLIKHIHFQESSFLHKLFLVIVIAIIAIIVGLLIAKFANIQKIIETYMEIKR